MFATHFLMPAADVVARFRSRGLEGSTPDVEEIALLASRYRVSLEAMTLRLEELGLMARGLLSPESLAQPPSRYFGRRRPDWRRRVGERYTRNAVKAYYGKRISVGKLARYLGIDIRKAIDLVEKEPPGQEQGDSE